MSKKPHPLPEGLSDYLKPTLRIFLSVDIVNSTAFKQSLTHFPPSSKQELSKDERVQIVRPEEQWFSPIASFYRGIERKLADEWEKRANQLKAVDEPNHHDIGEPPSLWKASGDEVLYVKRIDNPQQALLSVRSWMGAVNSHREELKKSFPILDLKAAAWLAGFPVNNAEVVLRRTPEGTKPFEDITEGDPLLINFLRLSELHSKKKHDDGDLFRDYIGPSMDTGFRVATLASPRKFALTIDLAYLVAHAATSIQHCSRQLSLLKEPTFHYEGRIPLKGVSDGAPYPFFWIDMKEDDGLLQKEDSLMGRKRLGCAEVSSFCNSFFEDRHERGPFMTPYIFGYEHGTPFSHIPEHHTERLEGLAYWSQELQKRKSERDAQLESNESVSQVTGSSPTQVADNIEKLFKAFAQLLESSKQNSTPKTQ